MKAVLQNRVLEKQLLQDGYVVIPFLTQSEVTELKDFYYKYHASSLNGMYATAHVADIDLRMKMNDRIKEKLGNERSSSFTRSEGIFSMFHASRGCWGNK